MQENLTSENGRPLADDEISIKKVIIGFGNSRRYLATQWKLLFIAALIGMGAGLIYAYTTKPVYTAEYTFVLQESDKSDGGLGQYSSLASMVGIDVGGSSSLFQGDNITQLYNSRLMLEKTLLSTANFNGKNELLIDRYLENNGLRKAWKDNPHLGNIRFDIPKEQFGILQDSILSMAVNDITRNYLTVSKPDKKLSLVSVDVKSSDQLFAKAFTERIVDNVNTFYIQTKTKGAMQNVQLLQRQADSVHHVLDASIGKAASAADENPNPDPTDVQSLHAPAQRREVNVQASSTIYAEVTRNLEIARGALQRETPLIQAIDQPILPLPVERAGKLKSMLTGLFIAVLLMAIGIGMRKGYRGIMS